VYAVAPNGDDIAAGDAEHPFLTIAHGLQVLAPGDTLLVHAGEYHERVMNPPIRTGRPNAPVTVTAAPGERPVVKGLLWLTDPTWWSISGINVTWANRNHRHEHMVKFTGGTDWSFTDAEVSEARSFAAILVAGTPARWRLANLFVHDTHRANGDNQDHLIYLNSGPGGGVIERCVLAHSPNGRAIKIGPVGKRDPEVRNITVRYTTMYDNRGPSNVQFTGAASDNRLDHDIMAGAERGRANVTALKLRGRNNVISNSVGFESTTLFDADRGLVDGGGNVRANPRFANPAAGDFHPMNPAVNPYGRYAP